MWHTADRWSSNPQRWGASGLKSTTLTTRPRTTVGPPSTDAQLKTNPNKCQRVDILYFRFLKPCYLRKPFKFRFRCFEWLFPVKAVRQWWIVQEVCKYGELFRMKIKDDKIYINSYLKIRKIKQGICKYESL
jgi:hypothetical protein